MKTILVKFSGELTPKDMVIIESTHPRRGGRSTLRYDVPEIRDSIQMVDGKKVVVEEKAIWEDVIRSMCSQATQQWDGFRVNRHSATELVIHCNDGSDENLFTGYSVGAETEKVELTVFA